MLAGQSLRIAPDDSTVWDFDEGCARSLSDLEVLRSTLALETRRSRHVPRVGGGFEISSAIYTESFPLSLALRIYAGTFAVHPFYHHSPVISWLDFKTKLLPGREYRRQSFMRSDTTAQ